MSLPSGYKRLEYIQSNGAQYIDTGFKPNQNTRVRIVAEWSPSSTTSWLFGARNATNKGAFAFLTYKGAYRADYGTATTTLPSSPSGKITVDLDKNAVNLNGVPVATATAQTFTTTRNLVLFANNTNGTIAGYTSAKLYSCQIYDNGTLIRDFIPCKNPVGGVLLWDNVTNTGYTNSSIQGGLTDGPEVSEAHKTLINGTAYELKSGKPLINGTGYALKKGRTRIDGTGYDIALQSGTPLSVIPVGNTVKIAVNGTMRDWIVVNQGIPSGSALYDDSCNGTWLLMKDVYTKREWDPLNSYNLNESDINDYLNREFPPLLNSDVREVIKQIKIPYYQYGIIRSGADGWSCMLFPLSMRELNIATAGSGKTTPLDGAKLSYFSTDATRIAYFNGAASTWWTRSVDYTTSKIYNILPFGYEELLRADFGSMGIRPAMILPFDTPVADDGTVLG